MKDRFFGLFGQTNKFKTVDAKEFATFIKDIVNLTFLEGTYTKIANETLPKDKPVALYCRRKQDYPCRSFLAVGNYYMEPKVLKIVREDQKLKRAPLGFNADGPYIEYVKLKNFCLSGLYDDTSLNVDDILTVYRSAKPLLDYINRAIEYSREEYLL